MNPGDIVGGRLVLVERADFPYWVVRRVGTRDQFQMSEDRIREFEDGR